MKIAIIGATGGSGRHFLDLVTKAGHDVVAMARTVDKLSEYVGKIEAVHADGRDTDSLKAALSPDVDVVVNIVGAANLSEARRVPISTPSPRSTSSRHSNTTKSHA